MDLFQQKKKKQMKIALGQKFFKHHTDLIIYLRGFVEQISGIEFIF